MSSGQDQVFRPEGRQLSGEQRRQVVGHLTQCPECAQEIAALRFDSHLLGSLAHGRQADAHSRIHGQARPIVSGLESQLSTDRLRHHAARGVRMTDDVGKRLLHDPVGGPHRHETRVPIRVGQATWTRRRGGRLRIRPLRQLTK